VKHGEVAIGGRMDVELDNVRARPEGASIEAIVFSR
jgi:hypothetical protein